MAVTISLFFFIPFCSLPNTKKHRKTEIVVVVVVVVKKEMDLGDKTHTHTQNRERRIFE